jgi:chaperonin GroES
MREYDTDKIRPLWNQVLIEEEPKPTKSEGGFIVLPDTARDAKFYALARVLAVGRGKRLKNGSLVEPELKKGDRVVLGKAHGTLIQGSRVRMIDADVIEAIIEGT